MNLLTVVRWLITIGSIFFLIYILDVREVFAIWRQVNPITYLLVVGVFLVCRCLAALRWKLLLDICRVKVPFLQVYQLHLFGFLVNYTLPTNIGGDLVKIEGIIRKRLGSKSDVVVSTIIDRLLGILALFFYGVSAVFFSGLITANTKWVIFGSILGMLLIVVGLIFSGIGATLVAWLRIALSGNKCSKVLQKFFSSLYALRFHKQVLVVVFVLALLFQGLSLFNQYLSFLALDIRIPLSFVFLVLPVARLITSLPFSVGGIGLNEVSLVFLFGMLGVESEAVIAYSLVGYSILLLSFVLYIVVELTKYLFRSVNLRKLSHSKSR